MESMEEKCNRVIAKIQDILQGPGGFRKIRRKVINDAQNGYYFVLVQFEYNYISWKEIEKIHEIVGDDDMAILAEGYETAFIFHIKNEQYESN